jgi:hypothetical protein
MEKNYQEWPYKWFGFFNVTQHPIVGLPMLRDYQDANWYPEDLQSILDYLANVPPFWFTPQDSNICKYCSCILSATGSYYWDGEWLFPGTISHLIVSHSLRLPSCFLSHIRRRKYIAPNVSVCDRRQAEIVYNSYSDLLP